MPLIIITGLPCSGKTFRAQQLADYLVHRISSELSSASSSKRNVHVVASDHASLDASPSSKASTGLRDQIYNSAAQEKTARAEEFSAIKRALSRDCIVVADGLNYIKGYRYQLWCEAKAAGTRCCVVHAAAKEVECKKWNEDRLRAWGLESEIITPEKKPEDQSGKIGRNLLGDLMPESHTAIYGDRVPENETQSRSTSTDGNIARDAMIQQDDTMTLKSLYITDNFARESVTSDVASNGNSTIRASSAPESFNLPSTPLPPPISSPPYAPSTLTSLCMRYEPPSPFTRWDTPLFTVPSSDQHPPYIEIWDAIYPPPSKPTSKKALAQQSAAARLAANTGTQEPTEHKVEAVRPHQATILPTATAGDALQVLESSTLTVVQILLARAREMNMASGEGGALSLYIPVKNPPSGRAGAGAGTEEELVEVEITIPPNVTLGQPMLQRLRRKYTQIQRGSIAHGQGYAGQGNGRRGVIEGFLGFLDGEFGAE